MPARLLATEVKPDEVEHLVDPARRDVVGLGQHGQVVPGGAPGMEGLGVEQGADLAQRPAQLGVGDTVDGRLAGVGPVQPHDHAHGRRLARPVGTQETGDHPGGDREGQVVDGHGLAEALGEAVGDDHRGSSLTRDPPGTRPACGARARI